jgi:hypothetical protein
VSRSEELRKATLKEKVKQVSRGRRKRAQREKKENTNAGCVVLVARLVPMWSSGSKVGR